MPSVDDRVFGGDFEGGLPVGTKVGGYELRSILGQGSFGITYRACDLARDRDVAIKEYLPATLALRKDHTTVVPRSREFSEQFAWGRERFLEEANTLKRLDRAPSIVSVFDFLEANGTAYMVMALIEGETLAKRLLREQRLTSEALERLLFPLLDGLEQVHAIGFLHRDIKPANIMIGSKGEPTLIDFGASRAAIAERSTTITAVFTPGYAAVEQFTSTKLGPWSDIYGLAATLYHAITGHIPPSSLNRMLKDEYEPLTDIQPAGYSRTMLAAIDAAMAVPSDDRPRSIAEWRSMLRSSSSPATRVVHPPGRLARVVRKSRRARLNIGAPALALSGVVAAVLLVGAGYLALTANSPPTVNTAVLSFSAEQLEQALAERRKADALVADKRRLEEEARQKAEREAETKRQAEAALEQTRQAREKAEQELADMKARAASAAVQEPPRDQTTVAARREGEVVAERKAEADAAAARQAEEDARKKLEADAEAKRQADEALAKAEAERQRADEEARAKAAAEQAALRQASEEAQRKASEAESVKQAEAARARAEEERQRAEAEREKAAAEAKARMEAELAEKALGLDQTGRERLQVALTSLGFDTRGNDGIFGPRSREMIVAWQKARNLSVTGFLSAAQHQALLKDAASAVSKFDDQKKADEEAKAKSASVAPALAPATVAGNTPSVSIGVPDGTYTGGMVLGEAGLARLSVQMVNGRGTGTVEQARCGVAPMTVKVEPSGNATGELEYFSPSCTKSTRSITGRTDGKRLLLTIKDATGGGGFISREMVLTLGGGAVTASVTPRPSPDGLWRGTYKCGPSLRAGDNSNAFTLDLEVQLTNGSATWRITPRGYSGGTFEIHVSVTGDRTEVTRAFQAGLSISARSTLTGQYLGSSIRASGYEQSAQRECALVLNRA